jgi:hypothetical protein
MGLKMISEPVIYPKPSFKVIAKSPRIILGKERVAGIPGRKYKKTCLAA